LATFDNFLTTFLTIVYTWIDTVSWRPHSLRSTSHSALSP
jgi:hypothetical protein